MVLDQIAVLQDLPPSIQAILARLLFFISTLFLIWLLRRVITLLLVRPLRDIARRTGFRQDDAILDAMMFPIRLAVIALAIAISGELFRVGDALDGFIADVARTFLLLAMLVGTFRFIDLLMPSSTRLAAFTGIALEERLLPFIRTALKLVLIAVGIVIVLQEWNYDVTGLIAGFGLGGLAFSLAAQDTAANLFGFMALVSDNPFDVGEYILTPDTEGIVEHVGLRTTRIRRLDQALVYVPNNKMANSAITNWSRLKKRRLDYVLGVTYDANAGDIRVLLHRIREFLKAQALVDPKSVQVFFIGFGESSLDLMVRCYVHLSDWGEFQLEQERLNLEIMQIVAELKLEFAFPTTSVFVESLPPFDLPQLDRKEPPRLNVQAHPDYKSETPPDDPADAGVNITGQGDEPGD